MHAGLHPLHDASSGNLGGIEERREGEVSVLDWDQADHGGRLHAGAHTSRKIHGGVDPDDGTVARQRLCQPEGTPSGSRKNGLA